MDELASITDDQSHMNINNDTKREELPATISDGVRMSQFYHHNVPEDMVVTSSPIKMFQDEILE